MSTPQEIVELAAQEMGNAVRDFLSKPEHRSLNGLAQYVILSKVYRMAAGVRELTMTRIDRYHAKGEMPYSVPAGEGIDYLNYMWHGAAYAMEHIRYAMDAALGDTEAHNHDFAHIAGYLSATLAQLRENITRFEEAELYERTDGTLGADDEEAATGSLYTLALGALTHEESRGALAGILEITRLIAKHTNMVIA